MKLELIKCPSCGGNLKLKENTGIVVCEYCENTVFISDMEDKIPEDANNIVIEILNNYEKRNIESGNYEVNIEKHKNELLNLKDKLKQVKLNKNSFSKNEWDSIKNKFYEALTDKLLYVDYCPLIYDVYEIFGSENDKLLQKIIDLTEYGVEWSIRDTENIKCEDIYALREKAQKILKQ